jgi:dTMP kinase
MFITLEGPDGAGKTTQARLLVEELAAGGYDVVHVHEPGGTELGAHIRALLVQRGGIAIDPIAEALLFSACRAELVSEVIQPLLAKGGIVVADRFSDSTLAYQGAGRGLPVAELEALIRIATAGLTPDLTLLLDVPSDVGLSRLGHTVGNADESTNQISFFEELELPADWNRFEDEGRSFQERVRHAYQDLAARDPVRWRIIDATASVDSVRDQILEIVVGMVRLASLPLGQGSRKGVPLSSS